MKFITQAAKVLNEQKKYKRRLAVFLCLAVVVALGTAAALKMYGQAMSHKQKKLVCRYAAHVHTDECFDGEAVVCGYADYAVHLHNDDCYGPNGELVCHLPEAEAHVHTEECYTEQEVLICEEEGAQAHEHTEGCYTPERGELSCQMEEHMHEDSCYGENGEIICPLEEHQHDDNCYEWKDVLTCTLGGHTHTEDCYTREMRELSCNLEEHGHGEACYDESGELACQLEEHTHDDNCYAWEDVLTCQLEESDGGHVHGDGCYEMQKVLSCGKLELHTHDDSCCDENGALVCGLLQLEEHVHGEDCFETVELTEEEIIALSGAGEESVSGDAVSEDSVSGDSVSADDAKEAHEHTDECYDAAGGLICGFETAEEPSITKTFEDEDGRYIVTASYYEKAEIPEEAELKAEMITAESNGEHFAQRESEVRETLEDESVSMNALFKIGFYVEEEEVEPKDDVSVTVQFLDEDGFADGSPIAVVHFAEDGSKVLNGGKAKDKSTTFKTNSFSEFGIVDGYEVEESESAAEDGIIPVSESFEYEDDAYHITFHIDGKAVLSEEAKSDDKNNITDTADIESEMSEENTVSDEIATEDLEQENDSLAQDASNSQNSYMEESTEKDNKFELNITAIEKNSEEYAAVKDYEETLSDVGNPFLVRAMHYSLTYNGTKLNLDDCEVTAEISPEEEIIDQTETNTRDKKKRMNVQIGVAELSEDAQINELSTMVLGDNAEKKSMTVTLGNDGHNGLVAYSLNSANPEFSVQYYAYLDILRRGSVGTKLNNSGEIVGALDEHGNTIDSNNLNKDTIGIEVIDTTGKKLPKNSDGWGLARQYIYVSGNQAIKNKQYDFVYDKTLTEVFTKNTYRFLESPGLENFNKFAKEGLNYDLEEIWVLNKNSQSSSGSDSTDKNDWTIYDKKFFEDKDFEFTNNPNAEMLEKKILIEENTVMRLVGKSNEGVYANDAAFFDYDITDGNIYADEELTKPINDRTVNVDGKTTIYANTKRQGINSDSNYSVNGPKLAFGNDNTNTGLGNEKLGGYSINKANSYKNASGVYPADAVYGKCSFQLVQDKLDEDGYPVFNVAAPNLFKFDTKDKATIGKTPVPGNSLNFKRSGDTYTLSAVTGTNLENLDKIQYTGKAWALGLSEDEKRAMWVNQFWPMDDIATHGTKDHDLKFGREDWQSLRQTVGAGKGAFPKSDDLVFDHNSYFGMTFSVNFNLTKDYVGPLNYYFFGDDDMWVFLDGQLICDIGGVHQAAGEYVNLWDWIEQGSEDSAGQHTLKFFYTERGASGSTCWMQFTLPSVSGTPVEYPSGSLKNTLTVGKTVDGKPTEEEFEFTINLYRIIKDGDTEKKVPLTHVYSYEIQEIIDGQLVKVPTKNDGIKNGDTFYLKDGQSIIVRNLPDGAQYTIKETSNEHYVSDIDGTITANGQHEGSINWGADDDEEVSYINREVTYELPETGGSGVLLYAIAGVFCIIVGTGFMYKKRIRERRG